jgi:hypothetical protein
MPPVSLELSNTTMRERPYFIEDAFIDGDGIHNRNIEYVVHAPMWIP